MATQWFIVVKASNAWWIDAEGKPYGPFESRNDALAEAARIAEVFGDSNRQPCVYIADQHGVMRLMWSGRPAPSGRPYTPGQLQIITREIED